MEYTKEYILEKLKHFDDDNFIFESKEHIYTYDKQEMRGTTNFIENFYVPYDIEYWSKRKAKELGVTQQEILDDWEEKKNRGTHLGSLVHDYIENFYEKNSTELTDDEEANYRIKKFHRIYDEKLSMLESVSSEIKVFSKKYNLAGTIDKLFLYDGQLIIGDWKTNKQIRTDSDWSFNKLLPPFEKFNDNELNRYSLQLSLYGLILKEIGLNVSYMFICHIPQTGESKIYRTKNFIVELESYLTNISFLEN